MGLCIVPDMTGVLEDVLMAYGLRGVNVFWVYLAYRQR